MSRLKSALLALGLAVLFTSSLLHGSFAADGNNYVLFTTAKNKEKYSDQNYSGSIIIVTMDSHRSDVSNAASKRFKNVSVTAIDNNFGSLLKGIIEGRYDMVAIPASEVESGRIKSIEKRIDSSKLQKIVKEGIKDSLKEANLVALDDPLIAQE